MSRISKSLQQTFQGVMMEMKAIGFMKSVFQYKNGTPRQSFICPQARGSITIDKSVYNNPHHSLEGLQEYSHVWILFIFNQNNNAFSRAKVRPPRLGGEKLGIFATRSPYRYNPIGLTLAKLDEVKDDTIYVSGIDILDGTPIVDIKPYIPDYDNPDINNLHQPENISHQSESDASNNENIPHKPDGLNEAMDTKVMAPDIVLEKSELCSETSEVILEQPAVITDHVNADLAKDTQTSIPDISTSNAQTQTDIQSQSHCHCENNSSDSEVLFNSNERVTPPDLNNQTTIKTAKWLDSKRHDKLMVHFTDNALNQMNSFSQVASVEKFRLKYLVDSTELRNSIQIVLENDPRSIYRKQNPYGQLYAFTVDVVDITCWIDGDKVEVLRVRPITEFIESKLELNS